MATSKGFLTLAAAKKATTWGTPVAAGANDGIELKSESMSANVALIEDMQITGKASQRNGDAGNRIFSGDLATDARYEGLEVLLALLFGTAGAPSTVDTTAKLHKLKVNDTMEGLFATLAIKKSLPVVHEFSTAKVT